LPLVVIDAGHGGHDPGAISPHSGAREKDVTLAIARALRSELLATRRIRVALTRSDDRFLVLEERYGIARRLRADLFISLHADAAESPDARGASIYTLSEVASDREAARLAARENRSNIIGGVDLSAQSNAVSSILIDLSQRETMALSAEFARLLQREAGTAVKFRTTARRFAAFVVLKSPDTPSVLFEAGFISNRDDAALLASSQGQRALARGMARAVQTHFARLAAGR
jgi:N-acetylmuramoyl-L-alanine amidase